MNVRDYYKFFISLDSLLRERLLLLSLLVTESYRPMLFFILANPRFSIL